MSLIPPVLLELRAKASEVHTEIDKVVRETKHMADETEHGSSRMQSAYKGAAGAGKALAVGIAGAAVVVGGFSIEAASAAEVTDAKLSVALKNAGSSFDALKPKIEAADETGRKYGFTNDQTNAGLATLTTALGDPKKALADLTVAEDLARLKHIDLASAAVLVAKTAEGQSRGLKSLGIDLPLASTNAAGLAKAQATLAADQAKANAIIAQTPNAANGASKAHKAYEAALAKVAAAQQSVTDKASAGGQMLAALQNKVKGAATAYGDTFAGKMASARAGVQAIGEKIGKVLIPIIEKVITVGQQWASYLTKHKPLLIAIAAVIGGVLLIAIGAYIVSMAAAAVATIAATWPILLIIVGIGLLVAAILWLVNNWSTVTKFIKEVWQNVGKFFKSVGDAISKWWNGFWNGIIGFVQGIWKGYVNGWLSVFRFFHDTLVNIGNGISSWWNGLWSGIVKFVQSVWKGAANGIIGFFNGLIDTIDGLIGGLNTVLAGIKTISGGAINLTIGKIPHLPSFDIGTSGVPGPLGAPSLAVVHGGEPILSNAMMAGRAPIPQNVTDAVNRQQGGGKTVQQSVQVNVQTNATPRHIAASVGWELKRMG